MFLAENTSFGDMSIARQEDADGMQDWLKDEPVAKLVWVCR